MRFSATAKSDISQRFTNAFNDFWLSGIKKPFFYLEELTIFVLTAGEQMFSWIRNIYFLENSCRRVTKSEFTCKLSLWEKCKKMKVDKLFILWNCQGGWIYEWDFSSWNRIMISLETYSFFFFYMSFFPRIKCKTIPHSIERDSIVKYTL